MILIILFLLAATYILVKLYESSTKQQKERKCIKFGIFHPFCDSAGGAEKVLWYIVYQLQSQYKNSSVYVYTNGFYDKTVMLDKVYESFCIKLDEKRIEFVDINFCHYLGFDCYPYFTLLLRHLASIPISTLALFKFKPDVYIETMGFPFTYPVFKILGRVPVICYIHYPIMTKDMITGQSITQNSYYKTLSKRGLISKLNHYYLVLLSWLYYLCGKCVDVAMVNSSWTYFHIDSLWCVDRSHDYSLLNRFIKKYFGSSKLVVVYPPCISNNKNSIEAITDQSGNLKNKIENERKNFIVSIGQFRAEKRHRTQLIIFKGVLDKLKNLNYAESPPTLVIIGSAVNEENYKLLNDLKDFSKQLMISDKVKFICNASVDEIKLYMKSCSIGLHTTIYEHFGISVAEMAASGLIVVAHKSGGPLTDILKNNTQDSNICEYDIAKFLSNNVDDYIKHIVEILLMNKDVKDKYRRLHTENTLNRFSDERFLQDFIHFVDDICCHTKII